MPTIGMYSYIGETWRQNLKERPRSLRDRAVIWRKEGTITRLERPTRIDKARMLGYKAKQGIIVVRARVGRGGMRKSRPKMGRRPRHLGVLRIKAAVSMRRVAEKRTIDKYPNLKVMNSYYVYQDGRYSWYEVILVDPDHPSIKNCGELEQIISAN